jgi:hypothetical protein
LFPYLPQRPGYHKRLKAALPLLKRMIRELAMDSDFWTDTVWTPDSTRGATMVARALLEQRVTGRASVELACAEFLTVQGLLLGGEPVELAARSTVKSR